MHILGCYTKRVRVGHDGEVGDNADMQAQVAVTQGAGPRCQRGKRGERRPYCWLGRPACAARERKGKGAGCGCGREKWAGGAHWAAWEKQGRAGQNL